MTRRDIDELEALFADLWHGPRFAARRSFRPNVDSYHTDDPHELTVVVELPGVDPDSIAVVAGERMLVVAGERPRPVASGRVYQQMEIEELFADLWQVPRFSGTPRRGFRPNLDCFHTSDPHELTIVVELPGVAPETVQVVVGERVIAIAGERPRPKVPGRVYQQMEIEYGPFERQVRLVEDVDPGRSRARFEQGVLTIELPVVDRAPTSSRVAIVVERA